MVSRSTKENYRLDGLTTGTDNFVPDDVVYQVRKYKAHKTCHIIVDSCADFAPKVADRLGVEVIGFPYVVNGVEHVDDLWQSQTAHEFYQAMREGMRPTTSSVPIGTYYEVFERAAKVGLPTIYLGLTRGLSSSIESARTAADMVRAEYPNFELYVLDNLLPSAAAELLTIEVVRQASNGLSAAELYEWAQDARYFIHGYFTLENFDALAAGGRIPATAAEVGGQLDIKPELSYDLNGALTLRGMCRGRKKALKAIVSDFRDNYCHDLTLPIGIMSADAEKDADWLEPTLRKEPGCEDLIAIRSSISPVIGSHVGPGMVAVVFWGTDRREKISLTDRIARKIKGSSN